VGFATQAPQWMIYLHWGFSLAIIFTLIMSVNFSEVEEMSTQDKSPKFHLIFNPKTYLLGSLSVAYLLLCIFI
jgi:cytochrome b561